MLRIDLSALRNGPIEMGQAVPADDPALEGIEFELLGDVQLTGRLMEAGPDSYYWHGQLSAQVCQPCRRCLRPVTVKVTREMEVLYTEEEGADDPAAYCVAPRATDIDPGDAVREELILAVPDYVLCDEGCRGICAGCGADLNVGTCACKPEPDQRWAALEALKEAPHDEGRE